MIPIVQPGVPCGHAENTGLVLELHTNTSATWDPGSTHQISHCFTGTSQNITNLTNNSGYEVQNPNILSSACRSHQGHNWLLPRRITAYPATMAALASWKAGPHPLFGMRERCRSHCWLSAGGGYLANAGHNLQWHEWTLCVSALLRSL